MAIFPQMCFSAKTILCTRAAYYDEDILEEMASKEIKKNNYVRSRRGAFFWGGFDLKCGQESEEWLIRIQPG